MVDVTSGCECLCDAVSAGGDGVLLIFSLYNRDSLEATKQFYEELKRSYEIVPMILVGHDYVWEGGKAPGRQRRQVTVAEGAHHHSIKTPSKTWLIRLSGQKMAQELGMSYAEVCSKTGKHVDLLFQHLATLVSFFDNEHMVCNLT